jgi:hypothetical protein
VDVKMYQSIHSMNVSLFSWGYFVWSSQAYYNNTVDKERNIQYVRWINNMLYLEKNNRDLTKRAQAVKPNRFYYYLESAILLYVVPRPSLCLSNA